MASDIHLSWGDGLEARGRGGEAITLSVGGRSVVLDELIGGGIPELCNPLRPTWVNVTRLPLPG
ncbi:hypothetical protein [Nocardia sp. NPDC060259]|uniref:hypothetical protein n=1 Tax=Nocardia sp. NPDC060259 TaxID=3347088 RepID=UPI003652857F